MSNPLVAVIMGSPSDLQLMQPAADTLAELGIPVEVRVVSAHRTPERAAELARTARERGLRVLICGAGAAAHLAGAIAANTTLPVIGVPLARSLGGQDALLATVQMPAGIPVATVAIDGSVNAALLAAEILALSDRELAEKLERRRQETARKVVAADDEIRRQASRP
ncbi:MAG: 5-(carboxyamino)imidazole ribonucleotide mutase [Pseudomonadota bacterium]